MSEQPAPNFPDILGTITGGARLNLDVIQAAIALRPPQVPAGQVVEIAVLLQNASDSEIDVVLKPDLPSRDRAKQKDRFKAPSERVLCGLEPAQTGVVWLPVIVAPNTQPGSYRLAVDLTVKRLNKKAQRIRAESGGGVFKLDDLPEAARDQITGLRALVFGVDTGGKRNRLQTTCTVVPPQQSISALPKAVNNWASLWTMRDHTDIYLIAQRIQQTISQTLPRLTREVLFMPLLKTTQERFQASHYPLQPPEAIFITKILMLRLEQGAEPPTPGNPRPAWPRWFEQLCRILVREPALADQPETLVTRLLYNELIFDATQYGFSMVSTVTKENFGTGEEVTQYAENLCQALAQERPVDFARTYLPLVMAGLIANTRVTMPREQVRETVFILSKALEKRHPERKADNAFVFDLTASLIDRALDSL